MIDCLFTKSGNIYAGKVVIEPHIKDCHIVVPNNKLNLYRNLSQEDKTIERIQELAWLVYNQNIQKIVQVNETELELAETNADSYKTNDADRYLFVFGTEPDTEELLNKWQEVERGNTLANTKYLLEQSSNRFDFNRDSDFKKTHNNNLSGFELKELSKRIKQIADSKENEAHSLTQFGFVSFYKDEALDNSLSKEFNKPLNSMNDYVDLTDNRFLLFKPYGSCNWGWKFSDELINRANIQDWLADNNTTFYQLYFNILGDSKTMLDTNAYGLESIANKNGIGKIPLNKSKIELITDYRYWNYFPALKYTPKSDSEFMMPNNHYLNMLSYISEASVLVFFDWDDDNEVFNRLLLERANKASRIIILSGDIEKTKKNIQALINKVGTDNLYFDFDSILQNRNSI